MNTLRTEPAISAAASWAFVETFRLEPTGHGPLDGLCFAVKDLIDIAGHKTACGNPTWRDTHAAATVNAVCVDQLLAAGGCCVGKTVTDELAFSLLGENHFYGTPLNPKAPDRVPGGSSSGSASAVACGQADFALGTDTGGSVRVPAGNCGIWGLRPSYGYISVAGVNPLAPSFDTVGVLALSAEVLARAAASLLACAIPRVAEPANVLLIREAFVLAGMEIDEALQPALELMGQLFGDGVREVSLRDVVQGLDGAEFESWHDTFRILQMAEIESSLGAWVASAKPEFGPNIAASFECARTIDRSQICRAIQRREMFREKLQCFLGAADLLCMPTSPALAPLKGSNIQRDAGGSGYYPRALSLTSVAGLCKLPQVSLPLGERAGVPVGLSLLAGHGQDAFLLAVAQKIDSSVASQASGASTV